MAGIGMTGLEMARLNAGLAGLAIPELGIARLGMGWAWLS